MNLWHYELITPMGILRAAFDGRGRLQELVVERNDPRKTSPLPPREQREAKHFLDRQLDAYLAGTLRTFNVPLEPKGSPLQSRVWDTLRTIPYGQTCRLSDFAVRLGLTEEQMVMAVAASPIVILIPAHRLLLPGDGPLPRALRDLESGLGWRMP